MAEKTKVKIPFAQLEYLLTFERPMLSLVGKFQELIVPFTEALSPWGFSFEEAEFQLASAKPKEHVLLFQRPPNAPPPQVRVAVRWGSLTVSVDQPDWTEAESLANLCTTAVDTVIRMGNVAPRSQQISLAMHVQAETTSISELTAVLLTNHARDLMEGKIIGQGLILHRENAMILIDNSAAFANGLFVRMQRTFDPSVAVRHIGETLLKDERKLWDVLGLEGEL
jgi:hypothetical protein